MRLHITVTLPSVAVIPGKNLKIGYEHTVLALHLVTPGYSRFYLVLPGYIIVGTTSSTHNGTLPSVAVIPGKNLKIGYEHVVRALHLVIPGYSRFYLGLSSSGLTRTKCVYT